VGGRVGEKEMIDLDNIDNYVIAGEEARHNPGDGGGDECGLGLSKWPVLLGVSLVSRWSLSGPSGSREVRSMGE
jgi:hypothetical protein